MAALEEERRSRSQTDEAYKEHRAATADYVKGTRAVEKELEERLASQAAAAAVSVAHAQALEQQAVWQAEEEASIVGSLENTSGFFKSELEVREKQLGQVGRRYEELRELLRDVEDQVEVHSRHEACAHATADKIVAEERDRALDELRTVERAARAAKAEGGVLRMVA